MGTSKALFLMLCALAQLTVLATTWSMTGTIHSVFSQRSRSLRHTSPNVVEWHGPCDDEGSGNAQDNGQEMSDSDDTPSAHSKHLTAEERRDIAYARVKAVLGAHIDESMEPLQPHEPTFEQLARDVTIVMSAKDVPSAFIGEALTRMLSVSAPRGVLCIVVHPIPYYNAELATRIAELRQQYDESLFLHIQPPLPYSSQNIVRRLVLPQITTKYTMFLEHTSWCPDPDCLERLWRVAESKLREAKAHVEQGDVDYDPFVCVQPMLMEWCDGSSSYHSYFDPWIEEVENINYMYLGYRHDVAGRGKESTPDVQRWMREHDETGQWYLEDHAFLALTSFFNKHRELILMEVMNSRYEFLHLAMAVISKGGRVFPTNTTMIPYSFWCPITPESLSWVFTKRHLHESWMGCEMLTRFWGVYLDDSCTEWVQRHVTMKLRDFGISSWVYDGVGSRRNRKFSPLYYEPSIRRGREHANLILSALLAAGIGEMQLVIDGIPHGDRYLHYIDFGSQLYFYYNATAVASTEENLFSSFQWGNTRSHLARSGDIRIAEGTRGDTLSIRVGSHEYHRPEADDIPVPFVQEDMAASIRSKYPSKPVFEEMYKWSTHRFFDNVSTDRSLLAALCLTQNLRLSANGIVALRVADGGRCGEHLFTETFYMQIYWYSDPLAYNPQKFHRVLNNDNTYLVEIDPGFEIPVPAHDEDDRVVVIEWRIP